MKYFKIFLLIFLVSIMAKAQKNDDSSRFSVVSGLNFSGIGKSGVIGITPGFHLGASYRYKMTNWLYLRPSITYSMQGDRTNDSTLKDLLENIDYKLDYINIPLELVLKKNNFSFFVGPQLGILVREKKMSFDFGDFDKLSYGWNLGIQIKSITNDFYGKFLFHFDKTTSLTTTGNGEEMQFKNQFLQIGIGYYLN